MHIHVARHYANVFAFVLLGLFSVSLQAAQPNEGEREHRSILYWFGEGYALSFIDQTDPTQMREPKTNALGNREAQRKGVFVSWLQSRYQKPLLETLRVSRRGHLVADIYIGSTRITEVRTRFGEPSASGDDWLTYPGLSEICSDSFTFKFREGVLKEVDWQWCWD